MGERTTEQSFARACPPGVGSSFYMATSGRRGGEERKMEAFYISRSPEPEKKKDPFYFCE